jgi:hypothetical protein
MKTEELFVAVVFMTALFTLLVALALRLVA